jgi:sulfite reductase (NADPH) hemoprotein beta-component
MYRYDAFDAAFVRARAAEFRDQVARRLAGELSEEQFKPLRLMNGLYLQLHAYMLRVAIPYGVLSSRQLRRLARIARVYDRGYGHFTTRQNIQFNWPRLADAPDILDELADVDMHAIQTSGNCIRNVTSDHWAGAAPDEVADPRVWAEALRQWSTRHPEFSFLPRKFKIAITGAAHDRAAIQAHDIGLHLCSGSDGRLKARIYVGGGQGRSPFIAALVRDDLPAEEMFSYVEAVLRVYNRHGRRDNLYKARIKILVAALGVDAFAREVEAEFQATRGETSGPPKEEIDRIAAHFAPPPFAPPPLVGPLLWGPSARSSELEQARADNKRFARWVRTNTHPHRAPGYAIVTVSLKPISRDMAPGDATADQMDVVADLAQRFSFDEARVSHEQNLVLPHVRLDDLPAVWGALDEASLATPNQGLVSDIIACPGLDYCDLANARSIPLAQAIAERFDDLDAQENIGELKIKISGCINACGHHHVGHIGILGVDKRGGEFYQILLGGRADERAALGVIAGKGLSGEAIPDAIERVVTFYLSVRRDERERFIDALERLGTEPFEEALYASA